jgi:hypothetical protein
MRGGGVEMRELKEALDDVGRLEELLDAPKLSGERRKMKDICAELREKLEFILDVDEDIFGEEDEEEAGDFE